MELPDVRRTKSFLIRMSSIERDAIAEKAHECCLSLSDYMRRCALDHPMSSRSDQEMLCELRRQGGLIKHLASTDRQNAYEYRVALNLIQEAAKRVAR